MGENENIAAGVPYARIYEGMHGLCHSLKMKTYRVDGEFRRRIRRRADTLLDEDVQREVRA